MVFTFDTLRVQNGKLIEHWDAAGDQSAGSIALKPDRRGASA
jgi:predicted SnoaL-like aldol condensation-catalyzing enzyme